MSTELVEHKNDQSKFSWVRDGVQGNFDVLWRMIDIVRDSVVKDKGVEDEIKKILSYKGIDSYSDTEVIFSTIFNFVKENVDYLQDVAGNTESIKDARATLQDGFGDCDDLAILNATLLADCGYEPYLVIGKYPENLSYQHVYCCVYADGKRYVFDQALPNSELNREVQGMDVKEFGVFDERPETDGVQGIFRNFKNLVKGTISNAREAAPVLAAFAPFGFIGNSALRSVFGNISNEPQSLNELGSQLSGRITDITIRLQNGLIPQEVASAQAHKIYGELFSYPEIGGETFIAIEEKLKRKLSYINNYGTSKSSNIGSSQTLTYLGYAILVFGVLYLINKNKG